MDFYNFKKTSGGRAQTFKEATAPDTPLSQADGPEATIVLVSQQRGWARGYELHGLFYSFADAAAHVAKDERFGQRELDALALDWSGKADRYERLTAGAWWVAARQPIRKAYCS